MGGSLSRFTCNQPLSNEESRASYLCGICAEVLRRSLAAEPGEDIIENADDVPGNPSSKYLPTKGTPLTGVLEVNGDHDRYAVNLKGGTRYQITPNDVAFDRHGALEDPYVYLCNACGAFDCKE